MPLSVVQRQTVLSDAALRLFDPDVPNRALLFSVLEGKLSARVVFDDAVKPSCCLLRTSFHGCSFFAGDDQDFLLEALQTMRVGAHVVLIWPSSRSDTLEIPDGYMARYELIDFVDRDAEACDLSIPNGCEIKPMDPSLSDRCLWRTEHTSTCTTPKRFHGGSPGLCLVRGDEILCEAYAPWWADGVCELAVITPEAHRRKGYATLTCGHLARDCERLGVQTTWTCHQANAGSVGTARALGYQVERASEWIEYGTI